MNSISDELKIGSKASDAARIILDHESKEILIKMRSDLKAQEDCISISYSKLACWIIGRYFEQMFANDQQVIIKAHFNSKEYLQKLIQGLDKNQNAGEILQAALQKITPINNSIPARRGRKKRISNIEASIHQDTGKRSETKDEKDN